MDATPPEQPKQIENRKTNSEIQVSEPPLAPGMTRLYRAEDASSGPPVVWKNGQPVWEGTEGDPDIPLPWRFVENQGRWFVQSRELANELLRRIRENGTKPLPNAKLFYIDVPTADAESYSVANLPPNHSARVISDDHKNEFVLPSEIVDRKQVLPVATEAAPPPRLPVTEPNAGN